MSFQGTSRQNQKPMNTVAILARLEAKAGKEAELEAFLKSALPLAQAEPGTTFWFALKIGPSTFGIFDTFRDEAGRKAHLDGPIAAALTAKAGELLAPTADFGNGGAAGGKSLTTGTATYRQRDPQITPVHSVARSSSKLRCPR
jgi:quinol monooxygenase YgiN